MNNGIEKREHKRIEKPFMVSFKIKSDESMEMESNNWESITLKNLSVGGTFFFFYRKDLGIGTLLDLKIEVSKSMPIVNCVGKIIRIDKPRSTSMYGIAIKFVEIGVKEEAMINTAIDDALE